MCRGIGDTALLESQVVAALMPASVASSPRRKPATRQTIAVSTAEPFATTKNPPHAIRLELGD
jgi:hypothetical protein